MLKNSYLLRFCVLALLLGVPLTILPKDKKVGCQAATKATTKKKKKTLSDMNFDELMEAKNERLAKKDTEGAIRYLEKMVSASKDKEDLASVLMELADLFFDTGKLVKAEKLYSEFFTLYPGNEGVEKAHYKAILCSYYLTLDNDRDQTKTQETLTLANTFLDRKDIFKTYAQDVSSIQQQCYEKLCQSELNVTEFYLKRGKSKDIIAAQQRLDGLRKEYLEKVPAAEPHILALEIETAVKNNDTATAEQKRTILASRFPDNKVTKLAAGKKLSFVDRF
jgi:outer membrane assembly lipoprotein YfiO